MYEHTYKHVQVYTLVELHDSSPCTLMTMPDTTIYDILELNSNHSWHVFFNQQQTHNLSMS